VARELREGWERYGPATPLTLIDSPYRTTVEPVLQYVRERLDRHDDEIVTVYIVEYVIEHWWERALHNRLAERLRNQLLRIPGVMVTLVPYRLASTARRDPLDGRDR
jgi:hypothetical protein